MKKQKQSILDRSNAEAKFRSLALVICELLCLKSLIKELRMENDRPMKLNYDNKATISIAHNSVQRDKMKHIEVD